MIVSGVPVDSDDALLELVASLGTPTALGNGSGVIHDVTPRPGAGDSDLSSTAARFPLHTDSTFLLDPHAFVALACLSSSGDGGGESRVVRVDELRARISSRGGRDALEALSESAFPFLVREPGAPPAVRKLAIFEPRPDGWTVRYRSDAVAMALRETGTQLSSRHRLALLALEDALADESQHDAFMLRPGDVLLLDNRRVLHGRTAIADGAARVLRRLKVLAR